LGQLKAEETVLLAALGGFRLPNSECEDAVTSFGAAHDKAGSPPLANAGRIPALAGAKPRPLTGKAGRDTIELC
jgi:hypothetical protein